MAKKDDLRSAETKIELYNEVVQERITDAIGEILTAMGHLGEVDKFTSYDGEGPFMALHNALVRMGNAAGRLQGIREMPRYWNIEKPKRG